MILSSRAGPQGQERRNSTDLKEFKKRFLSGFVLTTLLLTLTLLSNITFMILVCLVSCIASWEWVHIIQKTRFDAAVITQICFIVFSSVLFFFGLHKEALLILFFGFIILLVQTKSRNRTLLSLGIFYIGLPGLSILWLRQDNTYGLFAVLYLFTVVIVTDTSSFILGRFWGGAKLAPKISPNKTWSGFLGGIFVPSFVSLSALKVGDFPLWLFFTTLLLSFSSQLGDLAESFLKRKFHVKDSSNMIPGHGGFLDRIDGLIFAALVSGLMALVLNPHSPAEVLLFGSLRNE